MQNLKNILVVVDTENTEKTALERAILIAKATGATLHLLAAGNTDSQSPATLDSLVSDLKNDGVSAKGHEIWVDDIVSSILHVQQAEACDLVIKDAREVNELIRAIFAPIDWKVLRRCPCPVLLVKNSRPWTGGKILAAIDADSTNEEQKILSEVILKHAQRISGFADAECHIATAHPSPMLGSSDPVYQNVESLEALYRDACQPYAELYNIDNEAVHVGEGPAESYIPQLADKLEACLVVMGTVARTGLKGRIVGNTAEQILDSITCDVLTLKPVEIIEKLENEIDQ